VAAVFAFHTGKAAVQIAAIETNGLLNPGQFNGTFQRTAAAQARLNAVTEKLQRSYFTLWPSG
jgi:hypothetical protein